jgi:YggT family protein
MAAQLIVLVRYTVFGAFAAIVLLAVASWLVRTRRVSPFSTVGRAMRQVTDPVLRPIERAVTRRGGNPVQAGWWLVIGVAVVGVVVVSLAQWLVNALGSITHAARGGPG